MKHFIAVTSVCLLAACATKNYPIATPLTEARAGSMTCEQLGFEMADVIALEGRIADEAGFDIRSAGAIIADFGIGNSNAKNKAVKAMSARKLVIQTAMANKNCPGAFVGTTEVNAEEN